MKMEEDQDTEGRRREREDNTKEGVKIR